MRQFREPDPETTRRLVSRLRRLSAAVGEILGEFKAPRGPVEVAAAYRAQIQGAAPGARREHLLATSELHDLVAASCPGDRVLLEMVLLSAHIVAYRPEFSEEVVREHYAFLEPLLPFAELTNTKPSS